MLVQQFFGIDKYAPFLNSQFIPFQTTVGEEPADALQERYEINSNPSVAFIQADGSLYDILIGYNEKPDEYLMQVRNSLNGIDTYASIKKAYDENPNDLRVMGALAAKHQQIWQLRPAVEICNRILKRPQEAKAIMVSFRGNQINLYEISMYAQAQGKWHEHQTTAGMEQFRKDFPSSILIDEVYENLADWYLRLPVSDSGRALYEEAASRYAENPSMVSKIVRFLTRTGDHIDQGDAFAKKLIAFEPENAGYRRQAAEFYLKHEKIDQALESYGEEFIRKHEANKDRLNNYAWFWALKEKNLRSALEMIQKAAVLEPSDANLYDTMSMVYWKQKDYGRAIEAEEKALQMKPGTEDFLERIEQIKKDMLKPHP